MPSLNLLVVGTEKDMELIEDLLEGAKKYVGPIKPFTAMKAVDAVSKLHVSCGFVMQACPSCLPWGLLLPVPATACTRV